MLQSRRARYALLAACLLMIPATAMAQEGTIAGTIRDDQAAVLPGVTVEVTSPALIGVRTTVSDGLGTTDSLSSIERIFGSNFNDVLTSPVSPAGGTQIFDGRAGSDTINGGPGFDRVDYRDDPAGVSVNLSTGVALEDAAEYMA